VHQLAAFLPHFRASTTSDTQLFEAQLGYRPRHAIQDRHLLLPYWYTLFFEHRAYDFPILRPVVLESPMEEDTFDIDYEYFIGIRGMFCNLRLRTT
jgi:alpha-glucosidase (family GH31 glycosyl hydrolase)